MDLCLSHYVLWVEGVHTHLANRWPEGVSFVNSIPVDSLGRTANDEGKQNLWLSKTVVYQTTDFKKRKGVWGRHSDAVTVGFFFPSKVRKEGQNKIHTKPKVSNYLNSCRLLGSSCQNTSSFLRVGNQNRQWHFPAQSNNSLISK